MKFLECSRCFSANSNTSTQPVQEITNPLVVTKRPIPKVIHPNKTKSNSTAAPHKKRFPALFNVFKSWPRRSRQPKSQKSPTKNIRKTVRVIEPPCRVVRHRPPTRTQRLIKMYEERATSPERHPYQHHEFVIDPPASFSGDDSIESHQNFRNKLNTLDFRRMNTVALEEPKPVKSETYKKNSYNEIESHFMPISKYERKTMLEDFLKERLKIEQTMIDLLNGKDPGSLILKKSRNEDKKVRFNVEENKEERCLKVPTKRILDLSEDGKIEERETKIKLSVDPTTKVEDFYVERNITFLKDKTIEDKALVLKIAKKDEIDVEEPIGMRRDRELVFSNFGKMTL